MAALTSQRRRAPLGIDAGARQLFRFTSANLGGALPDWHLEPRFAPRRVIEIRNRHARQPPADRLLDAAQVALFFRRHERECRAGGLSAGGAPDAMNVVVGHG